MSHIKSDAGKPQVAGILHMERVKAGMTFLVRVLKSIDYVTTPSAELLRQRQRVRVSKSAAVLVGFYIFHSIPNLLLLTRKGRRRYTKYGRYHSGTLTTKLVEVFLLGAGLSHGVLASSKAIRRWRSPDGDHKRSRMGEMMISGGIIMVLLVMHVLDFRFSNAKLPLDRQVMEVLDQKHRRVKHLLYWLFVLSVTVHAWRGASRGWLYRLGFRNEGPFLHGLCRFLIMFSFTTYTIPLWMDNPYNPQTDTPTEPPLLTSPESSPIIEVNPTNRSTLS
jgi:succinate dehydrogenase hydrophobic anchor subunit